MSCLNKKRQTFVTCTDPQKLDQKSSFREVGFIMAKYTLEFKRRVIQEYLDGKGGYKVLAEKFGVKNKKQVQDWVNTYQLFGTEGLMRKRENDVYTSQFKLDAIELYQTSEMSYREVANTLEMNNPSLIANWMRKFREEGVEGLSSKRGRPAKMPKEIKPRKKKSLKTDQERIKELEQQVRSLQIHNAFLKELRKLRKQEASERMKRSHGSSSASEDNSH